MHNSPIDIACPFCHASAGAKCLEKKLDGSEWINYYHPERLLAFDRIGKKFNCGHHRTKDNSYQFTGVRCKICHLAKQKAKYHYQYKGKNVKY